MRIERVFALPNKWTFRIVPIMKLIKEEMADTKPWVDPFAGMTSPAHIKNDINPTMPTEYHLDANVFLTTINDASAMGALYDPPYSLNQYIQRYTGNKETNPTTRGYRAITKAHLARIVKPKGKIISFGWNSNGCSYEDFRAIKRGIYPLRGLEKI